jgi:Tol biopolymer transport system component
LRGVAGAPRWSPDGHYIASEFFSHEHHEIYVVEVPGGRPRLVPTFPEADNGAPNWSRDGQWIYFYSNHERGPFQLWKVPSNSGSPVQVTKNGGVFAAESADGHFLYYSKFEMAGIWKRPLHGGEETRVLDKPEGWDWSDWALERHGIYFLNFATAPKNRIDFLEFATGKTILISSLDKLSDRSLAVSPDGRSIVFGQIELNESTIMLVKNFQ